MTVSLLAALLLAGAGGPPPLTELERAGRTLYREGRSTSGRAVNALVGGASLSAEQVTCAGCHGDDGKGRPEGGVVPTAIAWRDLSTPWGRTVASGRRHPPYDRRTLARAVSEGIDSGGTSLDAVMPRYSMPRAELEALVAYLQRLGDEPVPGVGPREVRIGTVLPDRGPLAGVGRALRGALEGWAAEVNAAGGVHGRRIALEVAGYDSSGEDGLERARRLVARGDLLALVSGFTPSAEAAIAELAEREGLPLVGPFTPWPAADGASRPRVFYLTGGVREQARTLAAHAVREGGPRGLALVIHGEDARNADAARAAAGRLAAGGWEAELVAFAPGRLDAGAVERLQGRGTEWLIFLGADADLAALLRWARSRDWAPRVLAAGSLGGRAALAAPAAFDGRVLLAMPAAPIDETVAGREALARAARRAAGGEGFRAARASAWAAGQVLAEGLRRAGRAVSRDRLAASLEGLNAFETGVLPPLSYGPARRIGTRGAWLVAADLDAQAFRVLGWAPED